MSWQKCPVCDGEGMVKQYITDRTLPYEQHPCNVCKGFGIISEITGYPPNNKPKEEKKGESHE